MFASMKHTLFLLATMMMAAKQVSAESYSVAMLYTYASEDSVCSASEEETIQAISEQALIDAGISQAGNSNNWKVFTNNGNGNGNGNGGGKHPRGNPDGWRHLLEDLFPSKSRELTTCGGFCDFMCGRGALQYCDCCACCGSSRRKLSIRSLGALSQEEKDAIAAQAHDNALDILNSLEEPLACLNSDYQISVEVQ